MGSIGAAFVPIPRLPSHNVNWFKKGCCAHWAKVGFEKRFIYKMKRGHSDPLYEKYMLKALGIRRLEDCSFLNLRKCV